MKPSELADKAWSLGNGSDSSSGDDSAAPGDDAETESDDVELEAAMRKLARAMTAKDPAAMAAAFRAACDCCEAGEDM